MIRKYLAALALAFALIFGNVSFEAPKEAPSTAVEQQAEAPAPTRHVAPSLAASITQPSLASAFAAYAARIATVLPSISLGTPAQAVELNPDVGCDNAGAWTKDPSSSNGWSVTGSKCVATDVTNFRILQGANAAIKEGHRYKVVITTSGYSGSGKLRMVVGHSMSGTQTGAYQLASSVTAIPDIFTTSLGLGNCGGGCQSHTDREDPTDPGAWRYVCQAGPVAANDPVVFFGQPGVSHLHQFYGNISAVDPSSTYATLRTRGLSGCSGGITDPTHPLNRSGYWHPAMLDGSRVIKPDADNVYYKRWSSIYQASNCLTTPSALGACVQMPPGLKMIIDGVQDWRCRDPAGNIRPIAGADGGGGKPFMNDWIGTCVVGDTLEATIGFNECWDGINIDSPTHRTHTAPGFNNCPDAFPYRMPKLELQIWWAVDAGFPAGKWRLSSDEMTGATPGTTMHADFFMGWSPTIMAKMEQLCWNHNYSCSGGDMGDGTSLKDSGTYPWCSNCNPFSNHDPMRYVPLSELGMSHDITGNGTFTAEIKAVASGKFGLVGLEHLNVSVDNISVTEVQQGHKGGTVSH